MPFEIPLELLWYILAGFILGFTTSTLWEWLYFRGERMKLRDQRIAELESELSRHAYQQVYAQREASVQNAVAASNSVSAVTCRWRPKKIV